MVKGKGEQVVVVVACWAITLLLSCSRTHTGNHHHHHCGRCVANRGRRLFALDALLDNQKRKRLPRHELLLLGNAEAEIERRDPLGKHKLAIVKCAAAATGNKGKGQWKGKSHLLLVLISRRSQMTTTTTTTGAKWQCDA